MMSCETVEKNIVDKIFMLPLCFELKKYDKGEFIFYYNKEKDVELGSFKHLGSPLKRLENLIEEIFSGHAHTRQGNSIAFKGEPRVVVVAVGKKKKAKDYYEVVIKNQ